MAKAGTIDLTEALFEAVKNSDVKEIQSLIDAGADINAEGIEGNTPLHWCRNAEIAELLIDNGADVNAKNIYGDTPLNRCSNADIAKLLIDNCADVNANKNKYGNTPLHICKNAQVAKLLIDAGADVNAKNDDDQTPLHWCSNAEIAELLIDAGADVNAKNKYGDTPLHGCELPEVAKVLIDKGADVNAKCNHGNTPLHSCYEADVAKLLIDKGADVNAKSNHGYTPLDLCECAEVAKLLIDADDDVKWNNMINIQMVGMSVQLYIGAIKEETWKYIEETFDGDVRAYFKAFEEDRDNIPEEHRLFDDSCYDCIHHLNEGYSGFDGCIGSLTFTNMDGDASFHLEDLCWFGELDHRNECYPFKDERYVVCAKHYEKLVTEANNVEINGRFDPTKFGLFINEIQLSKNEKAFLIDGYTITYDGEEFELDVTDSNPKGLEIYVYDRFQNQTYVYNRYDEDEDWDDEDWDDED